VLLGVEHGKLIYKIGMGLDTQKYHVALSFAGEDRAYVERVATQLVSEGVTVFYDKFEEATLWGKNLYSHLAPALRLPCFQSPRCWKSSPGIPLAHATSCEARR